MNSRFFHILPAALIALGCVLGTASVNAEIIGFDDFDGGKYGWNYNPSTGARAETSAEWMGTVKIENGKLVTQGDYPYIYFHPTEANDAAFQNKGTVISSVEMTVLGDTTKWAGLSYFDFGNERHFYGQAGGSNGHFGLDCNNAKISTKPVVQNQTYTMIALQDFTTHKTALWAFEQGITPTIWDVRTPTVESTSVTNWTTRIRLASGADTKTTWDNLTAATAFSDVFDYSPIKGFTEYYPFISESFSNYTEGKIGGQLMNGQIPYGYRPLTPFAGNAEIVSGGLEYDGWNQNSGMLKVLDQAQVKLDFGVFEELGLSAENSNLVGGEGIDGTLYYGYLMQKVDPSWMCGPELYRGSKEILGIGSTGDNNNRPQAFYYKPEGGRDVAFLTDSNAPIDQDTHLIIAKIEYNADGVDDLTLFFDPDLSLSEEDQADSIITTMQGDFSFDGITWRNGGTAYYDEYRMGLSWGSLMNHQVPEPSTFALLLGGIFTLGFLRRRAGKKAEKSI